jgi:hypothetical protein
MYMLPAAARECFDFGRYDTKANQCQKPITAKADPTNSHAASGAIAAEPAAGSGRGESEILSCRRKQELQRRFNPRCPSRFAVIAGLSFHVLKILRNFPAFLYETFE